MVYSEVQTQLGIGFAAGIQTRTSRHYGEIRNTPAMLHSCIVWLQRAMCNVFGLPSTGNVPTKLLHVSLCLCCLKTVVICFIEEKDPWEYGSDYGEATGKEQTGKGVVVIQPAYSLKWSGHTNGAEISTYNVSWQTSEPGTYSCPYLAILLQCIVKLKVYFFVHTAPATVKQGSSLF